MDLFDLHQHVEWNARLDARASRESVDWPERRAGLERLADGGLARLQYLFSVPAHDLEMTSVLFEDVVSDALREAAEAGAKFTQLRLPMDSVALGSFMEHFKLAVKQVQRDHPGFDAQAILSLNMWDPVTEEMAEVLPDAAAEGLAGIELLYVPYAAEADWSLGRLLARSAARSGLDVSVPVGAYSTANVESVLAIEGVNRVAHAVHAAYDDVLLQRIREQSIVIEVCLTASLLLGMVPSLDEHPLRRMLDAGCDVVLGTDSPLRLGTTIAREYELARRAGLSEAELTSLSQRSSSLMSIAI
ncbi:amidohydrolase family protein [Salininema proteolyticum]|uniref:Adenosine deaminase domain-containing protein n=1 Tax=Salininema proteolyticum TaxID=1607685 RepID=A0ABV8U0X3_9ACTN